LAERVRGLLRARLEQRLKGTDIVPAQVAYARDASAGLDRLAALHNGDSDRRFAHRLNLEQTGILGYSFGGAVAAQATRMDPRLEAAVNLDGRHWAEALQQGVAVPYMFVGEELLMPTQAMLASTDPAIRYEAIMDQIDYTHSWPETCAPTAASR
jgi:dienelactone hydrolase